MIVKFVSVAAAVLMGVAVTGCEVSEDAPSTLEDLQQTTTTTDPTQAADDTDYSRLLLQPEDLSDDEDTFIVRSTNPAPDGLPGASALFVNAEDTRAIATTVVIYPDAGTATNTLQQGLTTLERAVPGATPRPLPVGTDGTVAVGRSEDGSKEATLLLFTHGPALARLEFQSALGDTTTEEFVTTVGKMQQIALRTGLPQNE